MKTGWGLKANWCPEIKILIDLLRQDALYCQEQVVARGNHKVLPKSQKVQRDTIPACLDSKKIHKLCEWLDFLESEYLEPY